MKKAGVDKARKRLALARKHLEAARHALAFEAFEVEWYQLLVAANSADAIVESTANRDNADRPWYGYKVRQRKKDPLLRYMHQARNVDEHGIEAVTESTPARIEIWGDDIKIHNLAIRGRMVKGELGGNPTIKAMPSSVQLVTVRDDRYGDEFEPPREHLGKPLTDGSPLNVARLWLSYLEALVAEAETRVTE
jgi:hypothetical protein